MTFLQRSRTDSWSRPVLALAAAAACVIVAVTLLTGASLPLALLAAALSVALGATIAAPERDRTDSLPAAASAGGTNIAAQTRAVLETLEEPVLLLDGSGRIVVANAAARSIVGPASERKHISSVLRTPELLQAIARVRDGGATEAVDFTFLVPVERHFRAHIGAVHDAPSGQRLVLMHVNDLTAVRRAEEMRVDFVANASHELRTPLAAVSGFIDTLKGHAKNDPEARERFLDIMAEEAGRMRRLVDDLLSLTRIELNEHYPPATPVDVVALLHHAVASLTPLATADGVTLDIGSSEPLTVLGDRDDLIQVFQNLVHNAIKYGRDKGVVRIRFGRSDGATRGSSEVFISIQDEGEGIPREAIPRLTERFYRVDVKRSRERGGTGLGLAIVKHILNRHRGRLQIESVLGSGSVFTVFVPEDSGDGPSPS